MAAALGCVALGGCHWLFQLNDLHTPPDASAIDALGIDAYNVDAAVDKGCWSAAYTGDEDEDLVVDGCDNCPLAPNPPQNDDDQDGVGNVCDTNPDLPLEKIAYFHPMKLWNSIEWVVDGSDFNWQDNANGIQQANKGNDSLVMTYARLADPSAAFDQPMLQVLVYSAASDDDAGGRASLDRSAVAAYLITGNDSNQGIPSGVRCGIEFPLASSNENALAFIEKQGTSNFDQRGIVDPVPPALITMGTLEPGKLPGDFATPTCTVTTRQGNTAEPRFSAVITPQKVKVGVWTMNASATFVALFVTDRRP
jgi:hypothetical protein